MFLTPGAVLSEPLCTVWCTIVQCAIVIGVSIHTVQYNWLIFALILAPNTGPGLACFLVNAPTRNLITTETWPSWNWFLPRRIWTRRRWWSTNWPTLYSAACYVVHVTKRSVSTGHGTRMKIYWSLLRSRSRLAVSRQSHMVSWFCDKCKCRKIFQYLHFACWKNLLIFLYICLISIFCIFMQFQYLHRIFCNFS